MGSLIFGSTTVEGRNFDNLKFQKSKAGVPRPIIFGKARPIVGNIIASSAPRIVVKREKQSGGKGGPDVRVENEEIYRTYAIRICEGPVTGVTRIWRNGEIAYDRDSTVPAQVENNQAFLELSEIFLGSFSQMPSSVLQGAFGIEKVHAYRGTCYIVVNDENLTAEGGAIPQYSFEVERCEGFVLTSRPYAIEAEDEIAFSATPHSIFQREIGESLSVSASLDSIELIKTVSFSEYAVEPEIIDFSPSLNSIELNQLVQYSEQDLGSESISFAAGFNSITLERVAGYVEYEIETGNLDFDVSLDSIKILKV